jgi:hypothetical protein
MMLAARVIATSAFDLLSKPEIVSAARADRLHRLEKQAYTSLLLPDQKPPLDYRSPKKPSASKE